MRADCSEVAGDRLFFSSQYLAKRDHRILLHEQPITCVASIFAWELYVPQSGCHITAEVWRPVFTNTVQLSDATNIHERGYRLLSDTELTRGKGGHIRKLLRRKRKHIAVLPNDVIGLKIRVDKSVNSAPACLLYSNRTKLHVVREQGGAKVCELPIGRSAPENVVCDFLSEYNWRVTFSAQLGLSTQSRRELTPSYS